jgi:hypothetical protein
MQLIKNKKVITKLDIFDKKLIRLEVSSIFM